MTKQEMIHVAFRSKETGRYLFHVKWPIEKWEEIEKAAKQDNQSVEEFIIEAITQYANNYPKRTTVHHS